MPFDQRTDSHFEALKFLKEWSTALVLIQSGVLAILGGCINEVSHLAAAVCLGVSLASFVLSIIVAANVIGAIPPMVQRLQELSARFESIYHFRNEFGLSLKLLTTIQHLAFVIAILSFGAFVLLQITIEIQT